MTKENIAWVDVETNGLDPVKNSLLEIAVIVTDHELNILDEKGFHAIVYYDPSTADDMRYAAVPFVQEMHDKTGLWKKLSQSGALTMTSIDYDLRVYLEQFGKPGTMPVGGNSLRLDMNFMDNNLPQVAKFLGYRMRDVSSLAGFMDDWYDVGFVEKASDHTAMVDIRESIREARFYRDCLRLKGVAVSETQEGSR